MRSGQHSRLIAIVDDDESLGHALQDLIESEGLPAFSFCSAEQFLSFEARHDAACVIADIRMPGMSGLELQATLRSERCRIPVVVITADGDVVMRATALGDGAVAFLTKPFDEGLLLEIVHAALGS